jgi:hypothetical protein
MPSEENDYIELSEFNTSKEIEPSTDTKLFKKYPAIPISLMILTPFNDAIPLIITSITVGASIVNRTFMKTLGHLIGAIFVGAIAAWLTNRFVTTFLGYTIVYVFMCFKNGMPDTWTIVGIVLGFAALLFINMFVSLYVLSGNGAPYFGTLLISGLCGLIGVYMVQSFPNGTAYLYDFKGCSCDDCASRNKSICDNNNMVMLKQKKTTSKL